jgi:hypothetical protein
MNQSQPIAWRMKTISDRQSTLFDLEEYAGSDPVMWGWLEPEAKLGGDNLPPNSEIRGQIEPLPPNLEIVKVRGQQYFLTPTQPVRPLPIQSTWHEIKTQKNNQYLYLRWREENKKKSRCLGRVDALKYSE